LPRGGRSTTRSGRTVRWAIRHRRNMRGNFFLRLAPRFALRQPKEPPQETRMSYDPPCGFGGRPQVGIAYVNFTIGDKFTSHNGPPDWRDKTVEKRTCSTPKMLQGRRAANQTSSVPLLYLSGYRVNRDLSPLSHVQTVEIHTPSCVLTSPQHGSHRQVGNRTTRLA